MPDLRIRINRKRYKVWQLVKIDEGSTETLIDVMTDMLIDPQTGEYYADREQARQVVMGLDGEIFDDLQVQFYQELAEVRRATLPPGLKGRSS